MEKKYHPIVTFKSLIVEFLHRCSIFTTIEQSHHFAVFTDLTCQDQHLHPPNNAFVARLDGFKSVQPTRTTFEAAIDSRHHSI